MWFWHGRMMVAALPILKPHGRYTTVSAICSLRRGQSQTYPAPTAFRMRNRFRTSPIARFSVRPAVRLRVTRETLAVKLKAIYLEVDLGFARGAMLSRAKFQNW